MQKNYRKSERTKEEIEAENAYWADRCRLNDSYKFVSKEEVARFRDEYARIFRSFKNEKGERAYTDEEVNFEAYEYLDDNGIAELIHHGQTPEGLAEIMSM